MKRLRLKRSDGWWKSEFKTDIPQIDTYLMELDSCLAGMKSVRRVTLENVHRTLLDAHEQADGESAEQAVAEAIQTFGSPAEVAHAQRKERRRVFLSGSWRSGLTFASLMLVFDVLSGALAEDGWQSVLMRFVFNGTFFGLWMGMFAAFFTGYGTKIENRHYERHEPYTVDLVTYSRFFAVLILLVFGFMFVNAAAGPFGVGFFRDDTVGVHVFLGILSLYIVGVSIHSLFFRIHVDPDRYSIRGVMKRVEIPRNETTCAEELSGWYAMLPWVSGIAYRIRWQDQSGNDRRVVIGLNGELRNVHQLERELRTLVRQGEARNDS